MKTFIKWVNNYFDANNHLPTEQEFIEHLSKIQIGYLDAANSANLEIDGIDTYDLEGASLIDAIRSNNEALSKQIEFHSETQWYNLTDFVTAFNAEEISDYGYLTIVPPKEDDDDSTDDLQKKIEYINKVIDEHGEFTIQNLENEVGVGLSITGDIRTVVERFYKNSADVIVYRNDEPIDDVNTPYTELADVIDEIVYLAEQYEAQELQTKKRIS